MQPISIGSFQIIREIGRGGMGEVYLATDTRLDREVAIKTLPAHLGHDPDRLIRFQREAKVLASLNHPGIGSIYGLEECDGNQYLILEYIEGETLADRLSRGPMALDESLAIAKQIAEALEVAHEKGVVHRDLKPGNVMIAIEGQAKVLDFGLARVDENALGTNYGVNDPNSPTVSTPQQIHSPTVAGVMMGTMGYMSPEQTRGKPVDKRSDIFSFGCVLFEMLSGVQPFRGETLADVVAATLHRDVDFGLLPATTPQRVRNLLHNCLAKDRKQRLRDMGDARLELERAMTEPNQVVRQIETQERPSASWRFAGVVGTFSLFAVSLPITAFLLRPTSVSNPTPAVLRAAIAMPPGMTLADIDRAIAVSPDGALVLLSLVANEGLATPCLYVRDRSRLEFKKLSGTSGATYPFWSPDSQSVGFFADGKLKRLDLADNMVRVLADAPAGRGGSWGSKGTIVFAPSAAGGLSIVNDTGGPTTAITEPATQDEDHRLPHLLPDGERFLFFSNNSESSGIYVFDSATRQTRLIKSAVAEAFFVEPGFLIYALDGNLIAQPFDIQRLELTGSAAPIAADVYYDTHRDYVNAGISSSGTLVYEIVRSPARYKLAWMDLEGERTLLSVDPQSLTEAVLSNDGRRVAATLAGSRNENSMIVIDLERGIRTPLGDPRTTISQALEWTADNQGVLGLEIQGRRTSLRNFPVSGGPGKIILEGAAGIEFQSSTISPDGKTILLSQCLLIDKIPDIMELPVGQEPVVKPFIQTPDLEFNPKFSPSGDLVAYASQRLDDSSGPVLKVAPYPEPKSSMQVSASALAGPGLWIKPDEVAWMDGSRKMWSATIAAKDGALDVRIPKPLFNGQPLDKEVGVLDYDLQGNRFLVAVEDSPRDDLQLVIVSDWRAGLPAK